jgi:hypothetical protein
MNHLNQEEIVMAYYGEADAAFGEHLAGCDECRAELGRIAAVLDRVSTLDVPEPEADYESRVWERVSWRLRGEKKRAERRSEWTRWTAAAAMFAFAFIAGLLWNRRNTEMQRPTGVTSGMNVPVGSSVQQRDRILFVVLGNHMDQSERILVELTNLEAGDGADISAERERAETLLASNRLYRRTAEDRGQEGVATLLDDLEPVLLQIAHSPSQVSADELRAIQKRVEAKGLVLKLRVVRANVRGASKAQLQQPNV